MTCLYPIVGGMVGGVVGGMFGGPIGSQIGSQVGAGLGGMLESMIGQHGQSNVQGALNNNMMSAVTSQLSQAIQCAPGIPQFARDEMCQALSDVQQSCPAEPTTPGCQQDTDNSMSGLIDKIVNKVVDQIMQNLQNGGCESGSIQDMIREAVEEVVREQIGGGSEDGGCAANGGAAESGASAASSAAGGADDSSNPYSTANASDSLTNECVQDEQEAESQSESGGNWLVALAKAMGKMTGDHLGKMMQAQFKMENSDKDKQTEEYKNASEADQQKMDEEMGKAFTEAQAEFQAEGKLFAMCSEATSTVLKSIGEGLSSMARKQ